MIRDYTTPEPLHLCYIFKASPKKKRKLDHSVNELLPEGPTDEATSYGSLEFNEVLDEQALKPKSTVVNRAPLMTAWAMIVAERLGFEREEALSIGKVINIRPLAVLTIVLL